MSVDKNELREIARRAADWLAGPATIRDPQAEGGLDLRYPLREWRHGIKSSYLTKPRTWGVTGSIWHTGMAIRAFLAARRVTGDDRYLEAARKAGGFLLANQNICPEDPGLHGSLMAYEDVNDHYQTSTAMEGSLGLLELAGATGEAAWRERFLLAVNWLATHAYAGDGLFHDRFEPNSRRFWTGNFPNLGYGGSQRPLVDNAVMLRAWKETGETRYREIFRETIERLLRDEDPPGNWIAYLPCRASGEGEVHGRQAFWWGLPMFAAYDEFGDKRYLEAGLRAAAWYEKLQLRDGGFYYYTNRYGHGFAFNLCTSVCGASGLLWLEATRRGLKDYRPRLARSVEFIRKAQFSDEAADPNIRGGLFERPSEPDGTEAPGFRLRDIAATFTILALEQIIALD